ncbi:MAG: DUF1549 domain-containing protein, partial [Planctomycetaceae bacterium]
MFVWYSRVAPFEELTVPSLSLPSLSLPVWLPAFLLVSVVQQQLLQAQTDPSSLTGIVMDDSQARLTGEWQTSTSTRPFLGDGYIHDSAEGKGDKSVLFTFTMPESGKRHVLIAYTPGKNRAAKVPILIQHAAGESLVYLNQKKATELGTGFTSVGEFEFKTRTTATVLIETTGTDEHVIVDGLRILTSSEFATARKNEKKAPRPVTEKQKKPAVPRVTPPVFVRKQSSTPVRSVNAEEIQTLLTSGELPREELIDDIRFLRRASLDILGRQPTLVEYHACLSDDTPARRQQTIDRLLASPDFGRNWGNYWSDIIRSRQQEPQLTFHDYKPFQAWLTETFNAGTGWDEIAFQMITSAGTVGERPQGTFIAFHQGDQNRLAGETTRVFLSLKIACAECHDHPFIDIPQNQFHGMAAFYARTSVKITQNDSHGIDIQPAGQGEHTMPDQKAPVHPAFFQGDTLQPGLSDLDRRTQLAYWLVSPDNSYFARSFVNHLWARLMGRGFYDPIDDMGEGTDPVLTEVLDRLATHFIASSFDTRSLFRVILNTRAYQRGMRSGNSESGEFFSGANPRKLRADEVFDSLATAIELRNLQPPIGRKTSAVRFPVPPASTRDLVREAFEFDPSTQGAM